LVSIILQPLAQHNLDSAWCPRLEAYDASPGAYSDSKVLAVPSARRVARELGVDLTEVSGTGRNGVIRRKDVESFRSDTAVAALAGPAAAPALASRGAVADQRVPFRGVRRKVAEAMARSVYTAPHFTVVEEVDVTNLVRVRGLAKEMGAAQGVKVTYMPFIMAAVARCLLEFRMLNGHLDEEAGEIVNPGYVNLGIATDTPNGLIVPVISNVESKGMMVLAQELMDLAQRAREGKVTSSELRGSTFTITNAGNIGGTLATPIINFPDIAILGVHRIVKRPGVVESADGDRIEVRHYMNLSCSVDHRLADGADAARFVSRLRTLLEEPALLAL
jgi:pyruvate dehydrogenase E2 component (dihydrolipoamide acetyltransferase)